LPFVRQQPALDRQSAAVTHQVAVAANHAVAGQDDRKRIGAVGSADRAHRAWAADPLGDVFVAYGFAVGNHQQRAPDFKLKRGARRVQRQIKLRARAGEIFVQLVRRGAQFGFAGLRAGRRLRKFAALGQPQFDQALVVAKQQQRADGGFDRVVVEHGVQNP
jgi:hypothetical protein